MDKIVAAFTDTYDRKARLMPAVLALVPGLLLVAFYTDWTNLDWEAALPSFVAIATLIWLTSYVRELGKRKEASLLRKWEAFPSVTRLRHRDGALDRHTKERYHRAAELVVPDLRMPDRESEVRDPGDADDRYRAVTSALLPMTRDKQRFPLLFKELTNYGFSRNMLGVKPLALLLVLSSIAFCVWQDWSLMSAEQLPDGKELTVMGLCLVIGAFWLLSVNEQAVRRVSEAYAKQLHEALDDLGREAQASVA